MLQLTQDQLILAVTTAIASIGVGYFLFVRLQAHAAFRRRCVKVGTQAAIEGFDLFADLLNAIGTISIVEIIRAFDKIEDLFTTPGELTKRLSELFYKQLSKRLMDEGERAKIMKVVDNIRLSEQAHAQNIIDTNRLLEAGRKVAGAAAPIAGAAALGALSGGPVGAAAAGAAAVASQLVQ